MVEEFLAFARGEGTEVSDCDLVGLLGTIVRSAITTHREVTLKTAGDLNSCTAKRDPPMHHQSVGQRLHSCRPCARLRRTAGNVGGDLYRRRWPRNPGNRTGGRLQAILQARLVTQFADRRNWLRLSIARDLARGGGGDVELESSPMGGLRAKIRLPV